MPDKPFYTYFDKMGNRVFHRYVDIDGKRKNEVISEFPLELFIKSPTGEHIGLFGERLGRVEFESISEASKFVKEYDGAVPVYGQTSFAHQIASAIYPEKKIDYQFNKFVVLNFDIEVEHDTGFPSIENADKEILSVSMKVFGKDQRITFGTKPYKTKRDIDLYFHGQDEYTMLKHVLNVWKRISPDFITGWYIEGFDIPYLVNRMKRILGDELTNELSPFHKDTRNAIQEYEIMRGQKSYKILGITTMDYQALYMKFSPDKLESYKLDFVASHELGKQKVDFSDYGNSLMRLYRENYDKFVHYNEVDVELVEELDLKLHFIELAIRNAYLTKSRFQEIFGTVKVWDNFTYNQLRSKNIVIPPHSPHRSDSSIKGGYVKDPIPKERRWVVSFDLTSLYPSIIMMYNMSPETMVEGAQGSEDFMKLVLEQTIPTTYLKNQGYVMAANGSTYKQDKVGIIPECMDILFSGRKSVKSLMLKKEQELEADRTNSALEREITALDVEQKALKLLANSGYGAIANASFRYFKPDIAEGITLTGQMTIQYISRHINDWLNEYLGNSKHKDYVITCDTDSMYLNLEDVVKKQFGGDHETLAACSFLSDFAKDEIEKVLAAKFKELGDYVGSKNNKMVMKREAISDVAIFRGKKNYIMSVLNNEGVQYALPVLKAVGVEAKKSSTPTVCKEALKQGYELMFHGTNEQIFDHVKKFREEFASLPLSKIAFPRGVQDMTSWMTNSGNWKLGAPIHVKASIVYNHIYDRVCKTNPQFAGLNEKIKDGTKIKFVYLKTPNPAMNNAVAFIDELPPEFGLDKYIDRELQFEKTFLAPLESFLVLKGWTSEKVNTLDDLFE